MARRLRQAIQMSFGPMKSTVAPSSGKFENFMREPAFKSLYFKNVNL